MLTKALATVAFVVVSNFARAQTLLEADAYVAVLPVAPSYMMVFDKEQANLNALGFKIIKAAAEACKSKTDCHIMVSGHADTAEADPTALSLRRANAVKDYLASEGIPPATITVVGKGATQPYFTRGRGIDESENRRVEIIIQ
jgi:OOP family OmpA-OmpF porin